MSCHRGNLQSPHCYKHGAMELEKTDICFDHWKCKQCAVTAMTHSKQWRVKQVVG